MTLQTTTFFKRLATATMMLALTANTPVQAQSRVSVVRDAEIETLLLDYARPILKVAGLASKGVEVVIVNDPSFNAFVDGRRIFVNTGALMASETPNEIIGVIAHEAGHLADGHQHRLREQMARAKTMAIVGSLLGVGAAVAGSVSGNSSGASGGAAIASAAPGIAMRGLLSYRRSEEMNADQAAAKYLAATHQSAKGMLSTFKRFSQSLSLAGVQVDQYQISHPLPRERIAFLEELAHKSPYFDTADSDSLMARHQMMRAKIAAYSGGQAAVARLFKDRGSLPARYGDAIATDLGGNSAAALKKLDALVAASPSNPYIQEFRGEVLLKLHKAGDSAKAFDKALKLDRSKSSLIRARLGVALMATGDKRQIDRAVGELAAALQSDPDNLDAYLSLSQAYGASGDIGNAELSMAEGNFRAGNVKQAKIFAARALTKLPPKSPGARRANDILTIGK